MIYTYDETKTIYENKVLFDAYQLSDEYDWTSQTEEEKKSDDDNYTRIKLGIQKIEKKKANFSTQKEADYAKVEEHFNKLKSDAKILLGQRYQTAEDDDYNIPESILEGIVPTE